MTDLFDPLTLRGLTVPNRVWLAPMCQYSCLAQDGVPTDWHVVHLGARATGGFGLLIAEASAVVPEGRISPQDAGIWNDEQVAAWRRVTDVVHEHSSAAIGIQLAHAGRKASTRSPLEVLAGAEDGSVPPAEGGWPTVAPSAVAFPGLATPRELSTEEVAALPEAFAAAARRADAAGFDLVEIHAAHGYLLHEFCSPLSNQRTDRYGGDFAGRTRLVVEVVDAVRAAFPAEKPVAIRFSATDWLDGGWTVEETARLTTLLGDRIDLVDVSSGALLPAPIPVGPGYQVPLAEQVRRESGALTGAVGLITEPEQAQGILDAGQADVVLLARAGLREPAWPLRAAHALGRGWRDAPYPPQYTRGAWR